MYFNDDGDLDQSDKLRFFFVQPYVTYGDLGIGF